MADQPDQRSDVQLECICLGAALLSAESAQYLLDNTKAADFSADANATIRAAMVGLLGAGRTVDRNSLISQLTIAGNLQKVGGEIYVRSLESAVPFGEYSIQTYCSQLRDFAISRRLIAIGNTIKTQAQQGVRSQDVLAQAESYLRSMGDLMDERGNLLNTDELIERAGGMEEILKPKAGIDTGLNIIDEACRGLRPKEMTIIGANTSRGKSALAAQIAYYTSTQGTLVAYFSYEMGGEQLLRRLVSARGNIIYEDMMNGTLLPAEYGRAEYMLSQIADSEFHVCDIRGRNLLQVAAEVRQLEARRKKKVGLIVLDHIQHMRGRRGSYPNRNTEITEISGDVVEYCLENSVPVLVLSQLNRDNSKRKDGRPQGGDLRESGSLEQDASNVWLIHRPEFFDRENPLLRNKVVLILEKLRDGRTQDLDLRWNGTYMRFEEERKDTQPNVQDSD
jgi:replicative DNA helicase